MAISSKELAKLLGVSPSAVSLALNDKPGIGEEMRQKILAAAELHGIRRKQNPMPAAGRSIDLVCYKNHGEVFSDTPFFSAVTEGLTVEASRLGYSVRMVYAYRSDIGRAIRLLQESDSAGVILWATELVEDDVAVFQQLAKPIVFLDASYDAVNVNSVAINNRQGARMAARSLISSGHRRLGHLRSRNYIQNFGERRSGFLEVCADTDGCSVITVDVGSTESTAYADMAAYLAAGGALPTAFFADNDLIAISCMRALKDAGYRIPQDISIVGFDDIALSSVSSPALSTVHVYKEDLGVNAVSLLARLISEPARTPVLIRLCTQLIERKSVLDLNHND